MKKIIYILVLIVVASCTSDDGSGRFSNDLEYGWVRFFDFDTSANISISDIDCPDLDNPLSVIEIPVQLTAPINKSDLRITYQLEGVSGLNPDSFITHAGIVFVPADTNRGTIRLGVDNDAVYNSNVVFNVVLTSTNRDGITVGLSDDSEPTSYTVNMNLYDLTGTYESTSVVVPAFGGAVAPNFTAELTPVDGVGNQWEMDTAWGPNFIAWATGNAGFEDSLVYAAIAEVDNSGNVTITGNDDEDDFGDFDLGGNGTFDRCGGVFTYSINGGFFGGITVDVVLVRQ
ncbi:hypothetical protein [Kordia sp.]|uniref:hypothetical protein n=1 Tax=Kordia sp. TaxID=1965332 RepID=UPI003B5AF6FF